MGTQIEKALIKVGPLAETPRATRIRVATRKVTLAETRFAQYGHITGTFGAIRALNDARAALGTIEHKGLLRRIEVLEGLIAKAQERGAK